MNAADKELSIEELGERSAAFTGIPSPPPDASEDTSAQWAVASLFMIWCQHPAGIEIGRVKAVNDLLERSSMDTDEAYQKRRSLYRPHIERALGRALTKDELAAGRISCAAVELPESVGDSARIVPGEAVEHPELAELLS